MKYAISILGVALVAAMTWPAPAGGQSRPTTRSTTTAPTSRPAAKSATTQPVKPALLAVSFKNMTVDQLGAFFAEKLGKPVMISEKAKAKKISVISRKMHPLKEVLYLIRLALLEQGVIVDELPALIRIRPVEELLKAPRPTIGADKSVTPLLTVDPLRIVTKEFALKHRSVKNMLAVIRPMLTFGNVVIDPNANTLSIIDTVATLATIEPIVAHLDVDPGGGKLTEIIRLKHGDASEIVEIVRWQIAGQLGLSIKDITIVQPPAAVRRSPSSDGEGSEYGMGEIILDGRMTASSEGEDSSRRTGGASHVSVSGAKTPVTLAPNVARNWIIVVAPAKLMPKIKEWILALDVDKPDTEDKGYDLVAVKHMSITEVTRQLQQTIESIPNAELRRTTQVVPFGAAKKIMIFGSRSGRKLVRDILTDLDREGSATRVRETFTLKHADADQMADRIDTLFSEMVVSYKSNYYTSYSRNTDAARVAVVPDKRRNAITVITDRKTMEEIRKLLAEEDIAIDPGDVKPQVYELKYADVGEVKELLTDMFAAKEKSRSSWWWGEPEKPAIAAVGRLHGQFTFQIMPGANKLIVNTKNPVNYKVIDELIDELDKPQRAGLPLVIELKYANAEDLCEQLNALLAEPGTLARVTRAQRGLSDVKRTSTRGNGERSRPSGNSASKPPPDPGAFPLWWQSFKPPADQVPTSNLIGKIRIVPVYRRNSLMILAPEGFKEPIAELVTKMDQPGRQVMIQARIGEIQHNDQTTLGLRIASDPSILPPADTAVGAGATTAYSGTVFGGTTILGVSARVTALLHMLIEEFQLKILLEPTITTSDNEAAEFFDGQDVPVQTGVRESAEGTSTVTAIAYEEVGTRLRIRPHITQTGSVDLIVNLEISRIVPGSTALGNFIFDRREVTTHVIVQDGQTIMLSGIIRQEEFEDIRKVPLLGDIPLIGRLFRSIDMGVRNRELVVFITPHVMGADGEASPATKQGLKTLRRIEIEMPRPSDETDDNDKDDDE